MKNILRQKQLLLAAVSLLIFVIAVGGFLIIQTRKPRPVRVKIENVKLPPKEVAEPEPKFDVSTWKTYRNEKYGFEIKYPPFLQVGEPEVTQAWFAIDIKSGANDVPTEQELSMIPRGSRRTFWVIFSVLKPDVIQRSYPNENDFTESVNINGVTLKRFIGLLNADVIPPNGAVEILRTKLKDGSTLELNSEYTLRYHKYLFSEMIKTLKLF